MNAIWNFIKSEPVAIQTLIMAGVNLGAAFGLHVTTEQLAEINVFAAAFLGVITRATVVPLAKAP